MGRQCGSRKKGGVYLTVATSPYGRPLEDFMCCPPVPVDLDELGIGPRGVHLIERDGDIHVLDVVGEKFYPNALDIMKEGAFMNFSRRAEGIDYSRLTSNSRLVLIHKRAHIENYYEYPALFTDEERGRFCCPVGRHQLDENGLSEMCIGLWEHDLEEGIDWEQHVELSTIGLRAPMERKLECGISYTGFGRPIQVDRVPKYAVFISLPIGGIEVIEDPDDQTHIAKLEEASKCTQLTVNLVQE